MAESASPQPGDIVDAPADGDKSAIDVNPTEAPSPSDAKGDKPEGELVDFIMEGLENQGAEVDRDAKGDEAPPASETKPDQEKAEDKAKADADAKPEATDDDEAKSDEDRRFDKHPRFQKLIADRREFKEKAEQLEALNEEYKASYEAMDQFRTFMHENNLNVEQVNEAINLRVLADTDPNAFLDQVIPIVKQLAELTGRIPASDYQQQVDAGTLSREQAMQLSQERGNAQMQARQAQRQASTSQQERYSLATSAIDMVMNVKQSSDPDFAQKQDLAKDRVELSMRQALQDGKIPSIEEAQKMAEDAWTYATEAALRFSPKSEQKPINPVPSGASNPVQREPKSLEEAIIAGIEAEGGRVI